MKKKINWGIIGTGIISKQFAQDFSFVNNAELIAVSSRSQETADQFARTYSIQHAYGQLDDMLADPNIDAVYIGTPHPDHIISVIKAMDAGKAVLCEKPLTVTPIETRQIIDHHSKSNTYVMEAMWTYFLPAIKKAKQWLDEGRIGDLVAIKGDFGYPQKYDPNSRAYSIDLAGGALLDMGVYPVAFAWLFSNGLHPVRTQSAVQYAPNGVDDDISWINTYETGLSATLGTSFRARLRNSGYLIGTKGYIQIPDFFRAYECHLFELDTCVYSFKDDRNCIGLAFETQAVTDDILAGKKQSDIVPLASSQAFADHMELVRQSWE